MTGRFRPPCPAHYRDVARLLIRLGWDSPHDAQWTQLRDAMPELRDLLIAGDPPDAARKESQK